MARFTFTSISFLLVSLSTTNLALSIPVPRDTSFKIIISTPTIPSLSFAPQYLTANGTATSLPANAGVFSNPNSQLFAADNKLPIGAINGSLAAQVKPVKDNGKGVITTTFSIEKDSTISWVNGDFVIAGGTAKGTFRLNLNDPQGVGAAVTAHFGGFTTADSVPAQLIAVF